MKPVTIDNLDLKDHVRWATDQHIYDPSFISEASLIPPHSEITGLSAIYSSKVEELFELQKRNQHYASFCPPSNFHLFSKNFFSYRLFPTIYWKDSEEESEEDHDEESEEKENEEIQEIKINLIKLVSKIQNFTSHSAATFEKDKDAVLNLLESIQWVNKMLALINGRLLQYQKG